MDNTIRRQTATKAIMALITSAIAIVAFFGLDIDFINDEIIAVVASVLGPILVYFVPNKDKDSA